MTSLVNVLADPHFPFFIIFNSSYCAYPFLFLHIMVLNVLFTAKIYPVVTCQEFVKIGQSTDKNKLQLSLSTNFGMVHMHMTTILEWF